MDTVVQLDRTETACEAIFERRSDTRIPCALEARCQSTDDAEWPALAVNVSEHGARLVSFLDAQPAPVVSVTLKNRKGFTVQLPARLIHAQGSRNLWMMGCRFARPLTAEELDALVPSHRRNSFDR